MATYPDMHFPGTPYWFQAAVTEAISRVGVNAVKWGAPLECIGRYESNYGVAANICDPDQTMPIGIMQVSRAMITDAKKSFPSLFTGTTGPGDPVAQTLVAILHIDSDLNVTGGYGGIGQVDGSIGLLPRTDRGPGNVLRFWIANPDSFNVEGARDLYRGY